MKFILPALFFLAASSVSAQVTNGYKFGPAASVSGTADSHTGGLTTSRIISASGGISTTDLYARTIAEGTSAPSYGAGSTTTCDLAVGDICKFTIASGNSTMAFSNLPPSGKSRSISIVAIQDGSHTLTWPAAVHWHNNTAPTVILSSTTVTRYGCSIEDGTNLYCGMSGSGM